jgi:DNA-binding GntR family transcriptional regulator
MALSTNFIGNGNGHSLANGLGRGNGNGNGHAASAVQVLPGEAPVASLSRAKMTTNLRELAYEHIRSKLLEGRIPPGTRISSRALAREIGVSFIPVREAIAQLASEGLVDHEAGVGTFGTKVGQQDLRELYELREALEMHAVGQAAERIDDTGLAEMKGWNDALCAIARKRRDAPAAESDDADLAGWTHADTEFHLALLRAAGNKRIVRAVKDLRVLTQVFRAQRTLRPVEDLEKACDQHKRLIEALARRDADKARSILSEHIRFGCKNALESHQLQRGEAVA